MVIFNSYVKLPESIPISSYSNHEISPSLDASKVLQAIFSAEKADGVQRDQGQEILDGLMISMLR